jgi:hypothetical protein
MAPKEVVAPSGEQVARAIAELERAERWAFQVEMAASDPADPDLAHAPAIASARAALLDELRKAEEQRRQILVAFYKADCVACANLCDDVLDRSGALLGHVRDWSLAAGTKEPR